MAGLMITFTTAKTDNNTVGIRVMREGKSSIILLIEKNTIGFDIHIITPNKDDDIVSNFVDKNHILAKFRKEW